MAIRVVVFLSVLAGMTIAEVPAWLAPQMVEAQRYSRGGSYWGGYPSYHSSTAAEGYMRGMGSAVRSQGAYNLMTSEAMKNVEDARTKAIRNNLEYTKTFFQMREINREYRDAQRPDPLSAEQWASINASYKPKPLSTNEHDEVTGSLKWPLILQGEQFEEYRQQIESLMQHRAAAGGTLGPDEYAQMSDTIEAMNAEMRKDIESYSPTQYMRSRNFLRSLKAEVSGG